MKKFLLLLLLVANTAFADPLRVMEMDYATPPTNGQLCSYSTAAGAFVPIGATTKSTWTPTITPTAGSNSSTTILQADYIQIGKLVFFQTTVLWTQAGANTAAAVMTLPVTPVIANQSFQCQLNATGTPIPAFASINLTTGNGSVNFYAAAGNINIGSRSVQISGVYFAA